MDSNISHAIYIAADKIYVGNLDSSNKMGMHALPWDGEDVKTPLQKIHQSLQLNNCIVVLGIDYSYTFAFTTDLVEVTNELVTKEAQKLVSKQAKESHLEWHIVRHDETTHQKTIQVYLTPIRIKNSLNEFAAQNKITIDSYVPVTQLLLQNINSTKPVFVVWKKQEQLAMVVDNKAIFAAENISDNVQKDIADLFKYSQKDLHIDPKTILLSWQIPGNQPQTPPQLPNNVAVENLSLHPLQIALQQGIIPPETQTVRAPQKPLSAPKPPQKEDTDPIVQNKVEQRAPEVVENTVASEEEPKVVHKKEEESKLGLWIGIFTGILIIAGLIGGGAFAISKFGLPQIFNQPTPTPTPSPTPTSTPSPTPEPEVLKEVVKVEILNGSGKTGVASQIQSDLESIGYEDIEVGNAKNYDYTTTEIHTKKFITTTLIDEIKTVLKKNYQVEVKDTLPEDSSVDLQIIIGSSKASQE